MIALALSKIISKPIVIMLYKLQKATLTNKYMASFTKIIFPVLVKFDEAQLPDSIMHQI